MTAPSPAESFAVQFATLRGELRTDMADIKGSLAVLVERSNRHEEDVRQERAAREALERRVESLEARRWPLPALAILVSLAAVAVALLYR